METNYRIEILSETETQYVTDESYYVPKELRSKLKINRCKWRLFSIDNATKNDWSHLKIQIDDRIIVLENWHIDEIIKYLEFIKS
jgi:hypothetical protein